MRQNKSKIITDLAKENCKLRKNLADIAMYLAEIEKLYLELYQTYVCLTMTLKQDKKKKTK